MTSEQAGVEIHTLCNVARETGSAPRDIPYHMPMRHAPRPTLPVPCPMPHILPHAPRIRTVRSDEGCIFQYSRAAEGSSSLGRALARFELHEVCPRYSASHPSLQRLTPLVTAPHTPRYSASHPSLQRLTPLVTAPHTPRYSASDPS